MLRKPALPCPNHSRLLLKGVESNMPKWFSKMSGREQVFLRFFQWGALVSLFVIVLGAALDSYGKWTNAGMQQDGFRLVLDLKPGIDAALAKHKEDQKNVSYNRQQLSTRASSLADQVFPQRSYRELDTEERERYSQHTVRISFKKASYENVNQFAGLIRQESPYMFLSEVDIEPNYPPKKDPYAEITYDAVFHISSVEFAKD